jgi:hypothetical protein
MAVVNEPCEILIKPDYKHTYTFCIKIKNEYVIIINKAIRETLRLYLTNLTQWEFVLMEIMHINVSLRNRSKIPLLYHIRRLITVFTKADHR